MHSDAQTDNQGLGKVDMCSRFPSGVLGISSPSKIQRLIAAAVGHSFGFLHIPHLCVLQYMLKDWDFWPGRKTDWRAKVDPSSARYSTTVSYEQ